MKRSFVKRQVSELPEYNAGLPEDYVREKYQVDRIIRLASNENPLGASPLAQAAAKEAVDGLWKYSDPDSLLLRRALAKKTGIDVERIVVGNGSEDIICLLCRACLASGDKVVTVQPSFLLHEIYAQEQGATIISVAMNDDLNFDVQGLVSAVNDGCKMVIFSNPSNPVGSMITADELDLILKVLPKDCVVVMDEAYYEYVVDEKRYPRSLEQLRSYGNPYAVLRTFSKAFGIAGARVGYGLFSDDWFAAQIHKLRNPFTVNSVGQAAALAALDDERHLRLTVRHNRHERQRMAASLLARGFFSAESYANFLFVDTGRSSQQVMEKLLQKGIIVKPWTTQGYEQFLRVTVGGEEDNSFFLQEFFSLV